MSSSDNIGNFLCLFFIYLNTGDSISEHCQTSLTCLPHHTPARGGGPRRRWSPNRYCRRCLKSSNETHSLWDQEYQ